VLFEIIGHNASMVGFLCSSSNLEA